MIAKMCREFLKQFCKRMLQANLVTSSARKLTSRQSSVRSVAIDARRNHLQDCHWKVFRVTCFQDPDLIENNRAFPLADLQFWAVGCCGKMTGWETAITSWLHFQLHLFRFRSSFMPATSSGKRKRTNDVLPYFI